MRDELKHYHTYEKSSTRHKDWHKQVYRCIDPECNHYQQAQFIVGKRVKCHTCGALTVVEKNQVRNKIIVGLCCSKSFKAKAYRQSQEVLMNLKLPEPFVEETTLLDESKPERSEKDYGLLNFLKESEL